MKVHLDRMMKHRRLSARDGSCLAQNDRTRRNQDRQTNKGLIGFSGLYVSQERREVIESRNNVVSGPRASVQSPLLRSHLGGFLKVLSEQRSARGNLMSYRGKAFMRSVGCAPSRGRLVTPASLEGNLFQNLAISEALWRLGL